VQLEGDEQRQRLTRGVLYTVLDGTLRMLHPLMPYVTETAWQHLTNGSLGEALIVAAYPRSDTAALDEAAEDDWELVREIIRGIRNARNEANVEASRWIEAIVVGGDKTAAIEELRPAISRLARVAPDKLEIVVSLPDKPRNATALVAAGAEVYLPLAGMVDLREERNRLTRELERAEADVARRQAKLANENFTGRAPAHIVQGERDLLASAEATAAKLREQFAALNAA
jgi:valyl-tRNA synthetase